MLIMLTSAMIGGPRASAGTTTKLAQTASGGIARVAASRSGSTGGGGGGGGSGSKRNLLNFMMSLRSGLCGGVRVRLGRLTEMVNTACIQSLDFLVSAENSDYEDW